MKTVDIDGGIKVSINMDEDRILRDMRKSKRLRDDLLNNRDRHIIHAMVQKGLVNRMKDDDDIYYQIKSSNQWRD